MWGLNALILLGNLAYTEDMRWLLAASILFLGYPAKAYQAESAGPATFTQPFTSHTQPHTKVENPARRALLDKLDAEIARYKREGNKKKVAELEKLRASVEGSASDEELAIWSRKLNPPKEAQEDAVPTVVDAKPIEEPAEAATALGQKTVAAAAASVADNGVTEEGFVSLYDGGSRKTDAPAKDDLKDSLGPIAQTPIAQSPIAAPRQEQLITLPPIVGREVRPPRGDYPVPKKIPMEFQAPPLDTQRDIAKPASVPELEALAQQHGIPLDIFRMTYAQARKKNVDYRLVLAVMKQESAFRSDAKSHVGARGLMQVMPATGRDLGVQNANDLYDKQTSIKAGTEYIRRMWRMFVDKGAAIVKSFDSGEVARVKKAIAAYNAGPGNVQKAGGVPRFKETQNYVVKVLGNYYSYMRKFPPAIS